MAEIKILLVDDHDLVRAGLRAIIERRSDLLVVGEASDGEAAVSLVESCQPDLVILDAVMPGPGGLETTRALLAKSPNVPILILTGYPTVTLAEQLLRAGATGFAKKSAKPDELFEAIYTVTKGERFLHTELQDALTERYLAGVHDDNLVALLTTREIEILRLLAEGAKNPEVAEQLKISIRTVDAHRSNILKKLALRTNADLTRFAIANRVISL